MQYCTISETNPKKLFLWPNSSRRGSPKKTLVFNALLGVNNPSLEDTKNADAIDLMCEVEGKRGKMESKVYTLRPANGDEPFFELLMKLAQPNKNGLDFDKMPDDDAVVDRLYAQVLVHLAIPEGQRKAMMAQKKISKVRLNDYVSYFSSFFFS